MPAKKKSDATLLVCVNEKDHSKTALRFACARAKSVGCSVQMLYVVDPVDYNALFSVADVIKEDRIAAAEELLEFYVKDAKKWCGITPKYTIREGFVKDQIVETVDTDSSVNMLVLGVAADGSSNKGKLLTQLTEAIGVSFHIPLLIVPGNLTDQQLHELNK